ncbi:MAG TPA: glycosyltransferase family 4 protein [Blastocatellia bacterium]|nr:glycosyltransferase family 4 protein [Blastocatellia bacterium]
MKVLLFANTDWYLYNFRLPLAEAIRAQGHEVVLMSPPGRFSQRFEQSGFRWIKFPLSRRRLNPLAELITIFRLVQIYRRERPDLAHNFTIKSVLYGSIAARMAGVKAIVNALAGLGHFFSNDGVKARALRLVIKAFCRLALPGTQVIFQNPDDLRLFLESKLISEDATHLILGSGVDVERFKPRAIESNVGNRSVLLAARLLWAKGVAEFVEAARLVRESLPDAVFLIAGEADDGNPAAIPHKIIDQWKEQGDVVLLGHSDDMRALLQNVDVVALPSYYGEGVPRILIEAAASGLPLVATDMAGCREIVRHGVNGFLVKPKDARELAGAIRELLVNDARRAEMGRVSRRLACEGFSEEQVINETLRVYQQCLPGEQISRSEFFVKEPLSLEAQSTN